jgi:segregation and condensation protein B
VSENQIRAALKGKLRRFHSPRRDFPVNILAKILKVEAELVQALAAELTEDLRSAGRGLQLREFSGGWRLENQTRACGSHCRLLEATQEVVPLKHDWTMRPLSEPSLETLAIVALKQPLSTGEMMPYAD